MRVVAGAVLFVVGCGAGGGTLAGAGGNMGMVMTGGGAISGGTLTGAGSNSGTPTGAGAAIGTGIGIGGVGNGPGGVTCGAVGRPAQPLPPDILIALDTSSSMNDDLGNATCAGGCGQSSKWAAAAAAINSAVAATAGRVNWGLELFATKEANLCGAFPGVNVDTFPASAVAIGDALHFLTMPNGGVYGGETRQTRGAVDAALARVMRRPSPGLRFMVLITDGAPMCAPDGISVADDTAVTAAAIAAATTTRTSTFVVGVATGDGPADTSLLMMAEAGLGRDGGGLFRTSTGDDIRAALNSVADQTAGCTFAVPEVSADGVQSRRHIGVAVDGAEVPRDTTRTNGWDYVDDTLASVRLYGSACAAVTADFAVVTINFKCILP